MIRLLRKYSSKRILSNNNSNDNASSLIKSSYSSSDDEILSFEDLLSVENSITESKLIQYSHQYYALILKLYHIISISNNMPVYPFSPLYKRLIDSISPSDLKNINIFTFIQQNNERPIISIANNCQFKTMEVLALTYHYSFIQRILKYLPEEVQFVLLSICNSYFICLDRIDYVNLFEKMKKKYPKVKDLSFRILLDLTNNYIPKRIILSNTDIINYYRPSRIYHHFNFI